MPDFCNWIWATSSHSVKQRAAGVTPWPREQYTDSGARSHTAELVRREGTKAPVTSVRGEQENNETAERPSDDRQPNGRLSKGSGFVRRVTCGRERWLRFSATHCGVNACRACASTPPHICGSVEPRVGG